MENTMSRLLIETTVRQTLKSLQEDPKRSIRNLVDMARQFSGGRFQNAFFLTAHTMLKNEASAYYALVQDATGHIGTEHLVRFGMNLGYNSCTWGARRIRANEEALGFNIPWTVLLQVDETGASLHLAEYQKMVEEGEQLGIYTWMLFCPAVNPQKLFSLVRSHPDSAFFLFCPAGAVNASLTEAAQTLCNLMLVLHLDEAAGRACARLREARLPYSVRLAYSRSDASMIESGEAFAAVQRLHPVFTVLTPRPGCSPWIRKAVCEAAAEARRRQAYQTVPWDIYYDTCRVDRIISHDACWLCFDPEGDPQFGGHAPRCVPGNLFRDGLTAVIRQAYPKPAGETRS